MSEKISIRIPHKTIAAYRQYAEHLGIGYQTLINLTLAKHKPKPILFLQPQAYQPEPQK